MEERSKINYGAKALLPIAVFLVLYVGCGIVFAILGTEKPFNVMPRYVAVLAGVLTGLLVFERDKTIADKAEVYYKAAGGTGPMTFALVVLMAGGFAGACAAVGGKDSMVNLGISLIPPSLLIPGIFVMCAIISTCIGSSMGTVSVMAPIAVALAEGVGLNLAMVCAAAITGATFGDNLSMISDTTICATKGVGADMRDKFRVNAKLAVPAALITAMIYVVVSSQSALTTAEVGSYNLITVIPYLAVLVMALCGLDVVLVLAIGMGLAYIAGLVTGSADFFTWAQGIGSGMEGMFWVCVFVMMISGMIGLVRYYGGLDWLVGKAKKAMNSQKKCEYMILLFPMVLAAIIVNNTLSIIINAPIVKELGEKYKVEPKTMAALLDIGACMGPMVMPHGTVMMMVQEYSGSGYLDILKYEYYPLIFLVIVIAAIQFGFFHKNK